MLKAVSSITNAIGAVNYKGTWNANTNSPALASGVGTKGDYYVVGTTGTTTIDGISTWYVGDWAVFNGSVWQRLEGGSDDPALSLKSNATTGLMQIVGPAAGQTRVVTIPDANATMARTDAAQTFTGTQTVQGNVQAMVQTKTVASGGTQNLFYVNNYTLQATGFMTIRSASGTGITLSTYIFNIMGNGIATGVSQLATEDYGGGSATFSVTETRNSPGAPQNQVAFVNTAGANVDIIVTYHFITGYENVTFI